MTSLPFFVPHRDNYDVQKRTVVTIYVPYVNPTKK